MRAGQLNRRIDIEDLVKTADGAGGYTEAWVKVFQPWAKVEPTAGQKKFQGMQLASEITHNVEIHYQSGITYRMRVKYDGRYLKIRAITNPGEANERLQLFCEEIANA